ncbi:uncharacterized protein LOC128668476 [Microplitis demolitor]|uniref:uncharacterized protein LOC128668476 n=1 Tax=Microplitis demolitor TaxID=69319 RepID=UPI00235B5E14|nr:uncharacterized protein LOC128668476 [Microplitis demolitor]
MSDFRHISGHENIGADTLSRVEAISTPLTTHELVSAQKNDPELQDLLNNVAMSLQWQQIVFNDSPVAVHCDVSLEAVALKNGDTDTVALALFREWILRYGVLSRITSDQGGQFKSLLFQSLNKLFDIIHLLTTPYYPQSNGPVEYLHRQLKAALLYHDDNWYDALPVVILGLQAAWKEEIQATPAKLVYGKPIRLPGELLVPSKKYANAECVLRESKSYFNNLVPAETLRHGECSVF